MLNSEKYSEIKNKFVKVILKLMCYYRLSILWDEWIDKPDPSMIEKIIKEIMEDHSGTLNCLFRNENILLVLDWDCLNLSVYNPSVDKQEILEKIANSEGLFWRKEWL